jgi:CheY-like chemotaxis protein
VRTPPLPENERFRLEILAALRIVDTPPEQVFDDLVHLAALICDTPIAVIDFVDEQRVWFKAKVGLELEDIPREQSFSACAILQSDALIVPDPLADERFTNDLLVTVIGIRFYAGIPLILVKGQAVGTLAAMDRIPHLITAEQIDSLTILARRIVHELELRRTGEVRSQQRRLHLVPSGQPSASILLIEDSDNLRNLLQRTLEGVGFSVISASEGAEGLRLCQQHGCAINFTVSDIVRPELNGLEMMEQIRAVRPDMKFLFITGFADEFPELSELNKNLVDVLEKPFLPSELVGRVQRMLNQENIANGMAGCVVGSVRRNAPICDRLPRTAGWIIVSCTDRSLIWPPEQASFLNSMRRLIDIKPRRRTLEMNYLAILIDGGLLLGPLKPATPRSNPVSLHHFHNRAIARGRRYRLPSAGKGRTDTVTSLRCCQTTK